MRRLYLLACILALASCAPRPDAPPLPGASGAGTHAPGIILADIAAWSAGLAGLGLLVSIVLAWAGRLATAATLAGICASILVSAPIIGWVGDNLWWIALIAALVGLAAGGLALWARRAHAEILMGLDIDGDGKIGTHKPRKGSA